MAELRLRLREPIPTGERDVRELRKRPIPADYSAIVYVVHPSKVDGDYQHVAQAGIQSHLNAMPATSRVVLIAPPQESTYLSADTLVTDIRTSAREWDWVRDSDIEESVATATLVGGNLERCLGSVAGDVMRNATTDPQRRINLVLPLDSIYTVDGVTANVAFAYLLAHSQTPLEAIAALITSSKPKTISYGADKGEFDLIVPNGDYVFMLNGQHVGSLVKPLVDDMTAVPSIGEKNEWRVLLPPLSNISARATIQLVTKEESINTLDTRLTEKYDNKINHAKTTVLPKYVVEN